MDRLISFLKKEEVEFEMEKNLSKLTSIGTGGVANLFVVPKNREKFIKLLGHLKEKQIPFYVVGNMTNLLPSDARIEKVLVSTLALKSFSFRGNELFAESGVLFSRIILASAKNSLAGYENLFGIPGTVGGMLRVNAGAYGSSVSDHLLEVEIYDPHSHGVISLNNDQLSFFYRDSDIKKRDFIVLSAKFRLLDSEKNDIFSLINKVREKRLNTQPIAEKTLGSVFKRANLAPASYLIDRCGLKGLSVGGISVSNKHAGFFVNDGGGTSEDFLKLCDIVKSRVNEEFGVVLQEEFEYLS